MPDGPITKEEEAKPPAVRGRSFNERRKAAEDGDLQEVIDLLATQPLLGPREHCEILRTAVRRCAEKGFDVMTEKLLTLMLTFDAELLLRAQVHARQQVDASDRAHYDRIGALGRFSEDTVCSLDRVALLEDRVMLLAQTRSRLRHVATLGEGKTPGATKQPGKVLRFDQTKIQQA